MRRTFIIKPLLLFVCVILSACERSDLRYFPVHSDRSWQYRISISTMDGAHEEKYFLQNLPGYKTEDDTIFAKQTADGTRILYTTTEQGIYRLATITSNGQQINETSPRPILVYPLKIGTTWKDQTTTFLLQKSGPPQDTLFRIQEPVQLEYKITSVSDLVNVPAGTFKNCVKIEAAGRAHADVGNYVGKITITVKQTAWYAPDIGLIKSTRKEQTNSFALNYGEYLMELEK